MTAFMLRKGARALLTVLLLVTFAFFVLRLTGDPAVMLVGHGVPAEALEAFRARWGLDQPLWLQYFKYLNNLATGDFGRSFIGDRSAWSVVMERLPKTLMLMSVTALVTVPLGVFIGIVTAIFRDTWIDRLLIGFSAIGLSLPVYVLGILLILVFSVQLSLLPSTGSGTVWHFILPVATMAIGDAALFARFARSALLDALNQPFVITALAKGRTRIGGVLWHALPNAALPLVTVVGFYVGRIVAGAVITENVVAWPGIGSLLVLSVKNRDLAVVETIVILIGISMVLANLVVDLLHRRLDPRLAAEGQP